MNAALDDAAPDAPPATTKKAVLRHRRGNRWMHWINFPLIVIMIWSGLRIYWAEQEWAFGILDWELFAFFPDSFNEALGLNRKLARGLAFHLSFGWLFTINGALYLTYLAITGGWRQLVPTRQQIARVPAVVLHDLGILKEEPPKDGHYNAAQQLSYTVVVLFGAVIVLTGFALFKPVQLSPLVTLFGGYESARLIHFTTTMLFVGFFVLHMVQVARAGRRNFTSMVTGYEVIDVPAAESGDPSPQPPAEGGDPESELVHA
ncbi:MAG: cytochrome b/b6 domain-containing protein [Actinomycetota bacterium]